jgi:uncharacterized protein
MPDRTRTVTASKPEAAPFVIGDESVAPGSSHRFDLFAAYLPTRTPMNLPISVIHARKPGPCVWVSAAVHGDELNGVEIIRRVMERLDNRLQRGTLITAPIVNVFGFLQQSRYLPDRRDLNRSFPGSKRGSLASRLAHLFLNEIVARCSHGIDLHTAATDRSNYPQIRADLSDPKALSGAQAFAAPVMLNSPTRSGSLRAAARKLGIPVIVYEAGEPCRFNETAIRIGERGVLNVLRALQMVRGRPAAARPSLRLADSSWVRVRQGGLLRLRVVEGQRVERQQVLGVVSDPFGNEPNTLVAPFDGVVIGLALNPVVHGGDAAIHVGRLVSD